MRSILSRVKDKIYSAVAHPPKVRSLAVSDIYIANCQNKQLLRWDVAVKLLAIENYYGKNDFGFDLYAKMQNARAGCDRAEEAKENFVNLIRSWEERGYDPASHIYVDNDLTLQNGAHRLAMAIYHGMPYINAQTLHRDKPKDFGENFFAEAGFSQEEMELIRNKSLEIYNSLNRGVCCIIWAPAFGFSNEILADFTAYGKISNVRRYDLDSKSFEKTVRKIYAVDNIAKWKIDKKLDFFKNFEKSFISFELTLDCVDYVLAPSGEDIMSRTCNLAKKAIRGNHKDKVENYIYDILLHTCDNFYQSDYMYDLFSGLESREMAYAD